MDYAKLMKVAYDQAKKSFLEKGVPVGAALFDSEENLLGAGHNQWHQLGDPSIHGETDAFRKAGRQKTYTDKVMVTTLAPCWYCSGLIRQFKIGTVVVGENENFEGCIDWLRENGVKVILLDDPGCKKLMKEFIDTYPELWNEDIGETG